MLSRSAVQDAEYGLDEEMMSITNSSGMGISLTSSAYLVAFT